MSITPTFYTPACFSRETSANEMLALDNAADMKFAEAIARFNSNISYNGLLHAVTADVSTASSIVSAGL